MSTEQMQKLYMPCRNRPFLTFAKRVVVALGLVVAVMSLTSCGSGTSSPQSTVTTTSTRTLKITTSTQFSPTFDPTISDYVVTPSSDAPIQITITAPADTQVSVDGSPFHTQTFTTPVSISPGQSFSIVVRSPESSQTYYVRCLPTDFPTWTTERPGTPQAEYFVITPNIPISKGTPGHYVIVADSYGVPVWWYRSSDEPHDALLLPDGNIAWNLTNNAEEHKLNGALVRSMTVENVSGGGFDFHELRQLPNGDIIIIADVPRGPVDLSAYGGSTTGVVVDNVIEEIAPDNSLVWHWSAMDHIPVSETDPQWRQQNIQQLIPADPYHMNSVEPNGDGFIVSFRHLDSVIRVDKASGNIVWKLGGTHRTESLTFHGDPYGNFGGQHDARVLTDGTLTVHDNGTEQGRPPRAVRYSIDTTARTAVRMEQVGDPSVTGSDCCGSARKGSGGDWVVSWGLSPVVTELTPTGARVFRMTFNQGYASYRAEPVPFGVLSRTTLRAGMDAQFPR